MTVDEYRAVLKAWGLTPAKRAFDRHTVYQTRDGEFTTVADPEWLSEAEREAALAMLALRLGISLQ